LDLAKRAAKAARVPHQWLIRESGGSDARAVRASRAGVPTALVAIPARKTGGPRVLVNANDLEQTVKLVRQIVTTPYTGERGSRGTSPRAGSRPRHLRHGASRRAPTRRRGPEPR